MFVRRPLAELRPRYLDGEGRSGLGVSIICPRSEEHAHKKAWGAHRIEIWFAYPVDEGAAYSDGAPHLALHLGALDEPESFSCYGRDGLPLIIPGHWSGYVVEGWAYDALSWGAV